MSHGLPSASAERTSATATTAGADLDEEQRYLTRLYERLDDMRETARTRLLDTLRGTATGHQARTERDTAAALYGRRVAELDGVEAGLYFGRLDMHDGSTTRLGRIGIFDTEQDHEPLLIDWRAPAARPFYLATAASPLGVARRRHIRTRDRRVVGLDDETLDLNQAKGDEAHGLANESALLAAVTASRTGQMRDIVATIQAEQDHIIRADLAGVLVVQGGPGTGKTAVALHRAAYLLYTYREQLSSRGVLIVGPNRTFLRYIAHVLPSLAETGVVLRTLADLYPGVRAYRAETPQQAEVKGRPVMVDVLRRAIENRQIVPDEPLELLVDKEIVTLRPSTVEAARRRARQCGKLHNEARQVFARHVIEELTQQVAQAIGTDPYAFDPLGGDDAPGDPMLLGAADLADIRADLEQDPVVQRTLDRLWPLLTPQELLEDLFVDPQAIAAAAPELSEQDRALLHRPEPGGWSPSDVPLLDEAMELLGATGDEAQQRAEAERRQREEYAEGALEIAAGSRTLEFEDIESEVLLAHDLLDAATLAERQRIAEQLTTADRAAADRTWAYGHVIVDEAQELSPMAWRLLMRRSPSRSMTVVGDIAQTGHLAGARSWSEVFGPFVADRWRLAELTVNYRTPAEIMELAGRVLATIDPALRPPTSVRSTGRPPRMVTVAGDDPAAWTNAVVQAVRDQLDRLEDGRLAVLAPSSAVENLAVAIREVTPLVVVGTDADLTAPVVVLTVAQAKGLEFDAVIVVDPQRIEHASPRGGSDLYVALTRATQQLTVIADPAWHA